MNAIRWFAMMTLLLVAVALGGCNHGETPKVDSDGATAHESKEDAKVHANLAKLGGEDQKTAETQKFCPISKEPLGSMGVPLKVTIKDQPVFLCCSGCQKEALAEGDKTLGKVNELKTKNAEAK